MTKEFQRIQRRSGVLEEDGLVDEDRGGDPGEQDGKLACHGYRLSNANVCKTVWIQEATGYERFDFFFGGKFEPPHLLFYLFSIRPWADPFSGANADSDPRYFNTLALVLRAGSCWVRIEIPVELRH